MKYLVVIPARGGSKGIPHKNIYKIAGKPLLCYAIESVQQANIDCDIAVSTDDDAIMAAARKYQEVIIIKRPVEISHDTAKTEDALIHAISYMKEQWGKEYEAIITLQPTSPLRKPETIKAFLDCFETQNKEFDAQLTLSENRSDFWVQDETGKFGRLYPNAPRRRQERKPLYVENSAIYVTKTESLLKTRFVLGNNPAGYVIDEVEGIDINEWADIALAESYLIQKK